MGTLEKVLNAECASELFSKDNIKRQYREILREIHPDVCKDARAKEATEKLIELYERGRKGEWYKGATIIKNSKTGKRYRIKPIKEYDIGIGKMYLTKRYIIIEIEREAYKGRGNKEMKSISGLGSLPVIEYEDWGNGITVIKRDGYIPLREFWNNYRHRIPAKVCAWIVTRLLSYACGLKVLGLVHCNITIDSVVVDLGRHGVKVTKCNLMLTERKENLTKRKCRVNPYEIYEFYHFLTSQIKLDDSLDIQIQRILYMNLKEKYKQKRPRPK